MKVEKDWVFYINTNLKIGDKLEVIEYDKENKLATLKVINIGDN